MISKAVILAAGLGSRLKSITAEIPKAMVRVNGNAVIDYQIHALSINSIDNIIVVVGYHGANLISYLRDRWGSKVNLQFAINPDYATTNSAYSLNLAQGLIGGDDYIHMNCDVIFSSKLVKQLIASQSRNQIIINKHIDLGDNMEQVILDDSGKITYMNNIHYSDAVGKAMGLCKISSEALEWIIKKIEMNQAKGLLNDNFYGIIRECVDVKPFYSLFSDSGSIFEINNETELNIAEEAVKLNTQIFDLG